METEQVKLPPPPRLIASFVAGFDAIANHVTVILLPILVDVFLWLGPHFQLKQILLPLVDPSQASKLPLPAENLPDPAMVKQAWADFLSRFNLFAGLRTFPVGPASLMSGSMPVETPLGAAATYEIPSLFGAAGWMLLILVIGWLAGAVYFYSVSSAALALPRRPILPALLQVFVLCIFWLVMLVVGGLPLLAVASATALISPFLLQVLVFMFGIVALWLILPVFFSPHGIFAYQQDAMTAIRTSLRVMRYTLPTSGLFLLGIIIIGQGLDFLWRTPPATSWWTLVGIAAHAFVSTALLAASFVYYRDINVWLTAVMEQMKQRPASMKI